MRRVQAGFTKRARCLLAAGAAAMICGAVLGEQELVRGGAFAVALPIVAAIVVGRERLTVSSTRKLEPARATGGDRAVVQLSVTSRSALPTSSLMLEDTLPAQAKGRARFVLDRLNPHQTRMVGYRLPPLSRGEHVIGPLHIRLTDPFGLIDRTRSFAARSTLLITPTVEPLPRGSANIVAGYGDGVASAYIGSNGVDDHTTREYRDGDDLRRVHWRLTARAGTLMVRQDEQPAPSDIMLVLDLRFGAHPKSTEPVRAAGAPAASPSFEWLVSAAASIGVDYIHSHRPVTVLDSPQRPAGLRFASDQELLTYLAVAQPRRDLHEGDLLDRIASAAHHAMTIAVLAGLSEYNAERIGELGRSRGRSLAIVLDTDAFAADSGPISGLNSGLNSDADSDSADPAADSTSSVTPPPARPVAPQLERACALLRAAGWSVTVAGPGDSVASIWARILAQPEPTTELTRGVVG